MDVRSYLVTWSHDTCYSANWYDIKSEVRHYNRLRIVWTWAGHLVII